MERCWGGVSVFRPDRRPEATQGERSADNVLAAEWHDVCRITQEGLLLASMGYGIHLSFLTIDEQ